MTRSTPRYLFSGSSFGRVEACPASAALTRVDWDSGEARRGVGLHSVLCAVNNGVSRDEAISAIDDPAVREWASKIDFDSLPRGLAERSIAYDPVTGFARFTGDSERRYTLEPGEIPMTPDLIVHDGFAPVFEQDTFGAWRQVAIDATLTVVDYKSTAFARDVSYDIPQLEINCLATASIFGASEASWAVGVITPDGAVAWQRGHLTAAKLADVADRVRRTVANATAEQWESRQCAKENREYVPDVRRGPHCRWCPGKFHCPATRKILELALSGRMDIVNAEPGPAYVAVQAIEQFAESAREVIKDLVSDRGPFDTGDGRMLTLNSRGHLKLVDVKT